MTGRRIVQPGPAPAERLVAVEALGVELDFEIAAGALMLDRIGAALAARGLESAVLELEGGAFAPFTYVIPALSTLPQHAAFFSAMMRPAGETPFASGRLTYGLKDGAPFFHCHGFWTAEGRPTGGHVIPQESVVAQPIRARGLGLLGAAFVAEPDPETGFQIFGPVARPLPADAAGTPVVAIRIRPNEDTTTTFEAICAARGWTAATIRGGVASTIGARFQGGGRVENFATEVYVTDGRIGPGAAGAIDVALIDYTGALAEGRLRRGDNPVLMTFEAVVQPV